MCVCENYNVLVVWLHVSTYLWVIHFLTDFMKTFYTLVNDHWPVQLSGMNLTCPGKDCHVAYRSLHQHHLLERYCLEGIEESNGTVMCRLQSWTVCSWIWKKPGLELDEGIGSSTFTWGAFIRVNIIIIWHPDISQGYLCNCYFKAGKLLVLLCLHMLYLYFL